MGLDMIVVKTRKDWNYRDVFEVLEAVKDGFDWYLGDDKDKRTQKYGELKKFAMGLTTKDVLDSRKDGKHKRLDDMPETEFSKYLACVKNAIQPHQSGNSHMFFDEGCEAMGGKEIAFSTSWGLRNAIAEAKKADDPGDDGYIIELDKGKLAYMGGRQTFGLGFKLWLAKWIGFFMPEVGARMLYDAARTIGVDASFLEIYDIEQYGRTFKELAKDIKMDGKNGSRYWLESAY